MFPGPLWDPAALWTLSRTLDQRDVIDRFVCRGPHLLGVVCGKSDHRAVANHLARIDRQQIFLPQVQSRVQNHRVIGAIVHYECCGRLTAQVGDFFRLRKDIARPEALVPELEIRAPPSSIAAAASTGVISSRASAAVSTIG